MLQSTAMQALRILGLRPEDLEMAGVVLKRILLLGRLSPWLQPVHRIAAAIAGHLLGCQFSCY